MGERENGREREWARERTWAYESAWARERDGGRENGGESRGVCVEWVGLVRESGRGEREWAGWKGFRENVWGEGVRGKGGAREYRLAEGMDGSRGNEWVWWAGMGKRDYYE